MLNLFNQPPIEEERDFKGPGYEPQHDSQRLSAQLHKVYELMRDGEWRTLREITTFTGAPEASASACLRYYRRKTFATKFGPHVVNRRRRGEAKTGLFEYQLIKPTIF